MRKYQSVRDIKIQNPGVKGWILMTPGGSSFILTPDDIEPTTPVALLGILER